MIRRARRHYDPPRTARAKFRRQAQYHRSPSHRRNGVARLGTNEVYSGSVLPLIPKRQTRRQRQSEVVLSSRAFVNPGGRYYFPMARYRLFFLDQDASLRALEAEARDVSSWPRFRTGNIGELRAYTTSETYGRGVVRRSSMWMARIELCCTLW
ncbi:hypothetical protein DPSP01_012868 [Paraphaeosphaeria sporulosa]|uniref:Uncharacterized protein n=1 Tax=Paraphaeosphaeria sporulosa TaxID=1460663 RepID=A0A177CY15_9PLEO|nr:uncharacterized protein CC84DRAFT_44135 [Paraphaeosphaeria sporulosa]OAG11717.1 hypothetical protein CC84DRAFT_44135 [Paraphaeosphaeria sporulosa]